MPLDELAVVETVFFDEAGVRVTNLGILKDVESVELAKVSGATIEVSQNWLPFPAIFLGPLVMFDVILAAMFRKVPGAIILVVLLEVLAFAAWSVLHGKAFYSVFAQTSKGTFFLHRTEEKARAQRLLSAVNGAVMERAARRRTPDSPYRS